MIQLQNGFFTKKWDDKHLVFLLIVLIMASCNSGNDTRQLADSEKKENLFETEGQVPQQPDSSKIIEKQPTIEVDEESGTEKEFVFNWIAAEPGYTGGINKKALMFYLNRRGINWKEMCPDSIKPRTEKNPTGFDVENMTYGDFPWNIYTDLRSNDLMGEDTFLYYAVSGNKLLHLNIDSIETEVAYYRGEEKPSFNGRFIGYHESEFESISYIFQTNRKGILDQIKLFSVEEKYISELKGTQPSLPNGIVLRWEHKNFIGFSGGNGLKPSEAIVIQIAGLGDYLITSWWDGAGGQVCDKHYKLFLIKNEQLKIINENNYNCDA